MVRRGCTLIALLFAGLFALYFVVFTYYFEWPGNLFAAGLGSLFGAMWLGSMGNLLWAWRDTAAFRRAARGQPPVDGRLIVVAGPIRPLGAPLTSPFGGRPCVAYEYEVVQRGQARRGKTSSRSTDMAGLAMAASAIDTAGSSVRLLGFPLLDQFPQSLDSGPEVTARARQYAASTPFEAMRGLGVLRVLTSFDDALGDADGVVRKDFRMTEEAIPFEHRTLGERIVRVGEDVCALGRYDAEKRALVPSGATLNRLWPGTPATVRRTIVATARSQAVLGLTFFAVSHAMLGAAFYLSETRYARQDEAGQASAIRSAVQDHDVAALERAVRQGANPNARDAFGDAVLLDVRDPAMAAALLRLGADVDVRHPGDADTPLIRAARMGNADLVRVLLAARADVHAAMTGGETAWSEAVRGGHQDVMDILRAAGADAPGAPVERAPIDVERDRPTPVRQ
jgi:Ankyrin repeats (3 copies)